MKEEGFVKSVSGDICEVIVKRKSACGENCASCKAGCEAREHLCTAKNLIGAKVGDKVFLEMDSTKVLKSAFLVYILPILVFLMVFVIADEQGMNESMSALCAVVGSAIAFLGVSMYAKRKKNDYIPDVIEII